MLVMSNVCGKWLFGEGGCIVYGFFMMFFVFGLMMNFVGVVYEWYVIMCKLYENG